jgi:glycosyltransferase involved in cell wall biosynthesis
VRAGAGGAPEVNVLFLDQFSALGGAQQCLLDLLPAIEERGWSARVAVPPGGPLVDLLRARGVPVDEIPCGAYECGKKSVADVLQFAADLPRQTAAIGTLLDQSRTDLVYVNGPRLMLAAAFATRGRAPILFHAHNYVAQRSARTLEGLALRQSGAAVVACCDAVAQPLRKWATEVHTVPNGTADLGFIDRSFERQHDLRIGIIGRIAPEKGQAEFLRAAALLVRRVSNVRFVICGAPLFGDRTYYNDVLRLAAGLPVEFLDWQDDVAALMRELDVLVIASKHEGMPRVLLEAFSAGLPVVAFPVGGIPEVIEDEVTGFLTRRGDLAARLQEVLESDPRKLRAIAHNARCKWEQRYTLAAYRDGITNRMEQCVVRRVRETAAPRRRRSATQL